MSWETVALAFGSSVGDRRTAIELALRCLDARPDLELLGASRLLSTAPVGGVATRTFLNAVVRARTTLSAADLLAVCKDTERRVGRRPARSWADRVIDIDVILYGKRVITTPNLRIPHPRLAERDFFLAALAEAWPDAPNPWTGLPWATTLPARRSFPIAGVLPLAPRAAR